MSITAKAGGCCAIAGEPFGDRLRDRHDEAAALHAARQPRQEGLVVIDDQQRPVLGPIARSIRLHLGPGVHGSKGSVFVISQCLLAMLAGLALAENGNAACRPFCHIRRDWQSLSLRLAVVRNWPRCRTRRQPRCRAARLPRRGAAFERARGQTMVMRAPLAAAALLVTTVAPERSSRVLAMNRPSPSPGRPRAWRADPSRS